MYVFMLLDEMGLGQHRDVNMPSGASWGVAYSCIPFRSCKLHIQSVYITFSSSMVCIVVS